MSIQIELCRLVWSRCHTEEFTCSPLCVSWQHLSLQAAAGGQSETKKCAISAQTLFVTVSTAVWTDGTAPSIFLDRALVQLQFCPSGNVYLQSRHNDISLSAGSSNAIWAFLQLRTQEWRWNRGVVSGLADSIKGAVLKVGLGWGYSHVQACWSNSAESHL